MNSKQRSYLRSLANKLTSIFNIGKDGITDAFIKQVNDTLEVRELIKISVLNTSGYTAREASEELCESLGCEGVQAIGNKIVIYRKSEKNPRIELPNM
jgi:RNA-binding protein